MTGIVNKQTTLQAIAVFTNGGAWSQSEYSDEGVPVVRVTDIKNETVGLSDCKFLPKSSLNKYARHLLRTGDLVICTVGSHPTQPGSVVGRAAVVPATAYGALLNQNAVCIRSSSPGVDQGWLGYLGRSQAFHDYIISCARGSANQVRMAIGLLKEMPVDLPSLHVQQRIAGILSAYDELIENDKRRIKILESMARTLYREWFVYLRFPGHQDLPRVVSPLGEIPKGWECVAFTEIADVLSGGTPKTDIAEYWNGEIPFFTPRDAPDCFYAQDADKHVTELGLSKCSSQLYPRDTVFITARGTVGKVALPSVPMAMNQSCYALRGKMGISQQFLFLMTLQQVAYLKTNTGGATFDTIVVDTFRRMQIAKPPYELIAAFTFNVNALFQQVDTLQRQIQNLRRTRDLLLPRLLSGQIDVEAA